MISSKSGQARQIVEGNLFSNLGMAWKLALIVAVMTLGMVGVLVTSGRALGVMRFHLSNIYDFMLIPLVTINRAETALATIQLELEHLGSPTLTDRDRLTSLKVIETTEAEFKGVLDTYDTEWVTTLSPEFTAILRELEQLELQVDETTTLAEIHSAYDKYIDTRAKYLASVQAKAPDSQLGALAVNQLTETRQQFKRLIEINDQFAALSNQAAVSAYRQSLVNMGIAFALSLLMGLALVYLTARSITGRLSNLTQAALAVQRGQLEQSIVASGRDEIGILATTFNSMTAQLRDLIDTLEQRVSNRTRRLEIIAVLSERLNSILNLDELLGEVVNQVKDNFGYYHAHIYLLDDRRDQLVVAAGTGVAGAEMKAKGHNIPFNAPTSLVARAARSGEIIRVDNVREAADWLPNPLLPDTFSEMAVPIVLEEQVFGVLDVQQDGIAGLDEGDASLLHALANQVAVAIRNAQLFEEVETALAEARAAQERLLERSWQQTKIASYGGQYHYARTDAPALSEAAVIQARQAALTQNDPAVVELGHNGSDEVKDTAAISIVAPVKLQDMPIGTLQLHPLRADQPWTEDDLAVVAAVVDELAQTAENLRLIEEARERASFESLVGEINEKLRQSPTLDILAKTAAEALGNALGVSHSLIKVGVTPPPEHTARNGEQG